MIKLVLIILIIVCSVLIGNTIKNYLKNRYEIYLDFKDLIKSISNEISFLKTDKFSLLKNQNLKNKNSENFLKSYINNGNGESWILKENECKELNTFLNSIGKKDIDGEMYNLTYFETLIDKNCRTTQENYNKYGVFAIKMSILFGALLAIILI